MSMRPRALKVDVPTLEPDAVMIDRLTALSSGSTPCQGSSRSVGLRVAFVAAVVASLGATTWAAGAIPGVETPFQHRIIEHEPLVPTSSDRSVGSPQPDVSTSGGPVAAGLPDTPAGAPRDGSRGGAAASVVLPQGIVLPAPATRGASGNVPPGQTKAKHATGQQNAGHGKRHAKGHHKARHHHKTKRHHASRTAQRRAGRH